MSLRKRSICRDLQRGGALQAIQRDFDNALRLCEGSDVIIVTIGGSTAKTTQILPTILITERQLRQKIP